jgi:hypothetical protein
MRQRVRGRCWRCGWGTQTGKLHEGCVNDGGDDAGRGSIARCAGVSRLADRPGDRGKNDECAEQADDHAHTNAHAQGSSQSLVVPSGLDTRAFKRVGLLPWFWQGHGSGMAALTPATLPDSR